MVPIVRSQAAASTACLTGQHHRAAVSYHGQDGIVSVLPARHHLLSSTTTPVRQMATIVQQKAVVGTVYSMLHHRRARVIIHGQARTVKGLSMPWLNVNRMVRIALSQPAVGMGRLTKILTLLRASVRPDGKAQTVSEER